MGGRGRWTWSGGRRGLGCGYFLFSAHPRVNKSENNEEMEYYARESWID